ncbi:HAD-IA family hydrolase [Dactylosporangium sp. CA-092794]|uniref:HAD-IA family hydrolase n=1 Tax=Dactylosporangium sp. CA-092794 TaxID=3239929 RepID=UPI003D946498
METGVLAPTDFEELLANQLLDHQGRRVEATGLLARIFSFFKPDPIMIGVVHRVRKAGWATALITNSWGAARPWEDMEGLFDAVLVSCDLGVRKPEPGIYLSAADALGTQPDRCVFIDDHPANVSAAERVGMRGIRHLNAATTVAILAAVFLERPADPPTRGGPL